MIPPEELSEPTQGQLNHKNELFVRIYQALKALAVSKMNQERTSHTLQPTALMSELYLKLKDEQLDGLTEVEVLRLSATVMRNILIDHAIRKKTKKQTPPGSRISDVDSLADAIVEEDAACGIEHVTFYDAIQRVAEGDPELEDVVRLRLTAGLTEEQIANSLGISVRTVKRRMKLIKARLPRELARNGNDEQ